MDDARFDAVTRAVARLGSRRAVLRFLGGTAGASLLAGLGQSEASAKCKNHGRKCDKNRDCCDGRCKRGRCRCTRDAHCASDEYCKRGRCKPRRCPNGSCRVFLTSTTSNGNLGGLDEADSRCQQLADAEGLGGTFRAWLADETGSPATRFLKSPDPYVRIDGERVADNWNDLIDGSIQNPINVTEKGEPTTDTKWVWSNTNPDGTARARVGGGGDCQNWTSETGGYQAKNQGKRGIVSKKNNQWSTDKVVSMGCDFSNALYCFEQD